MEYPFYNNNFVDLEKEFSVENNTDRMAQILDIIYFYRNYNITLKYALYERKKLIYPINPYGENDSYVIDNGMAYKDGKNYISNKLLKYGLLKVSGSGLNYINLGAIVKLEEIFAIQFKDFQIDKKSNVNEVIERWLEFCRDKKNALMNSLKFM